MTLAETDGTACRPAKIYILIKLYKGQAQWMHESTESPQGKIQPVTYNQHEYCANEPRRSKIRACRSFG